MLQELCPSHPRAQPSTAHTSRLHHTHTCRLVWVIEDAKGQKVSLQWSGVPLRRVSEAKG